MGRRYGESMVARGAPRVGEGSRCDGREDRHTPATDTGESYSFGLDLGVRPRARRSPACRTGAGALVWESTQPEFQSPVQYELGEGNAGNLCL